MTKDLHWVEDSPESPRIHVRALEASLFWQIYTARTGLRSELAVRLRTSPATVSRTVEALLAKRLLIEAGTAFGVRGRKPHFLKVNPAVGAVAGLEIDWDRSTAVVIDMSVGLLGRGSVKYDARQGIPRVLEAGKEALSTAIADAGIHARDIAAWESGILETSISGAVSACSGLVCRTGEVFRYANFCRKPLAGRWYLMTGRARLPWLSTEPRARPPAIRRPCT